MLWSSALASVVVTLLCLKLLLSAFGRHLVLDHPNERSLHERPVPRTGGIAIIMGVTAGWAVAQPGLAVALGLAAMLGALSFADDVFELPTELRFGAHLLAATALVAWEVRFPGWTLFVVFVFAIAWYANLYNFMDGSDGLAGGMALIGFGTYAAAAQLDGAQPLAAVCATLAAGAAAFLTSNFPPARIFMGDVGSVPLGFLAGSLGLIGWNDGLWPLWFPLLAFAPFVCDATLTLLRRALRREPLWRAHREHYYQRLVRMGFGHRGTALIEYSVMILCGLVALSVRHAAPRMQILAIGSLSAALVAIAVWVDVRWTRFRRNAGQAHA
ncbi:MAG: glycosyltransferase family 4 protein [Betaproteobacteria bacterium]|nr:glycosyltransferase family 4 protein [Betaproteobacteria bacterium]